MLVDIPQLSNFLKSLKAAVLDDVVDRLNYFYTSFMIAFFATIVATKQHFGSPINCLTSSEFPSHWNAFVHQYCFITGTYDFKELHQRTALREHGYYQWIPFVLFGMALMFYVPHLIWKLLQKWSSLDLKTAVAESIKARSLVGEQRAETIKKVVDYAKRYLNAPNFGMLGMSGRFGMYSSVAYVFSKIWLINFFYGEQDYMWGYKLITGGFGTDPNMPTPFPRLTHCKFDVRDVGNTRPYEADCVIMINILNEKIFLVIWIWLHFVLVVTVLNMLYTLVALFIPAMRRRIIENHLCLGYGKKNSSCFDICNDTNKERTLLKEFTTSAMSVDGLQLIRFIKNQAGGLVAHEVIRGIWKEFVEERQR
uniref:Innexin n=1 Tax=Steinernema glaseri TaxID=37863 RepID=A0A1I8AGF2_9BILA